jgi:hypothetical protein
MTIGMSHLLERNFTLQSIPCELFLLLHIAIGVRFRKYKCMGDLAIQFAWFSLIPSRMYIVLHVLVGECFFFASLCI